MQTGILTFNWYDTDFYSKLESVRHEIKTRPEKRLGRFYSGMILTSIWQSDNKTIQALAEEYRMKSRRIGDQFMPQQYIVMLNKEIRKTLEKTASIRYIDEVSLLANNFIYTVHKFRENQFLRHLEKRLNQENPEITPYSIYTTKKDISLMRILGL